MADPTGIAVAFDDGTFEPDPTWTRLDNLEGLNIVSWSIDRGRPNEFSKTGTGTATVKLIDREGLLDPTNATSPYVDGLVPRKQAAVCLRDPVLDEWHTLFRGFVENWHYRLAPNRQWFEVELQLVDGFGVLSKMQLQAGEAGVLPLPTSPEVAEGNVFYAETAGSVSDRLEAVTFDAGWPVLLTEFFTGNVTVRGKTYPSGTPALSGLFDAVDAEFPGVANLYMSKDGVLTFHGRQPRFRPDVAEYGINERDVGDELAASSTVALMAAFEFDKGDATLFNSVLSYPEDATAEEIEAQLVKDDDSIDDFGLASLTFDNLQTLEGLATGNTALEETELFGLYYVENQKVPIPRISRMAFKSRAPEDSLAPAVWKMLTRAELSDLLNVETTHPGGGGFQSAHFIEGLHYEGRPGAFDADADENIPIVTLEVDTSPQSYWASNPFDADPDPS